jgi:insertion element IS1 protein InsB
MTIPLCPDCGSTHVKRNGHTHYGEQNYRCKSCGRQFVEESQHIQEAERDIIRRLLLERLSLSGICRVMGVSLRWLLRYIAGIYKDLPDDLGVKLLGTNKGGVQLYRWAAEADEMWSFVQRKENKKWIWIALDVATRQVLAFHVGDRSRRAARALWQRIPLLYRQQAKFYTDDWEAYKGVIPQAQHYVCAKDSGHTNLIERFNCTLRQRVSRLVRESLSFSKILKNHIGAIKYFICHYNLEIAAKI